MKSELDNQLEEYKSKLKQEVEKLFSDKRYQDLVSKYSLDSALTGQPADTEGFTKELKELLKVRENEIGS